MLRLLRLATALLVGAVAVVGLVAVGPAGAAPGAFEPADEIATAPATSPSRYEALGPCRIIDQRTGLGIHDADGHHIVTILDRTPCDIPDGATSILTTITITGPASDGFTVGYATGASVPEVAQLNHRRGETRANGALIPLSTNRSISFFRLDGVSSGSLVVDVVGAFIPSGPTSSGRLVAPDTATRLLDTRSGASAPPADRATLRVPLPDHVPADATALVVTAVVAGSTAPGFLTLSPAGSPRPTASTLNVDGPGQFRSGTTIVPVTADGFDVYVHSAAHVVIDTTGWVTGPSAEASTDGLFVAAPPTRLRDTRNEPSPINPGGTIEIGVPTPPGASAAAVLTSITMMQGDRPSFIAAHAARSPRGGVSSGNTLGGEFVAQASVTAMSPHGIAVFSLGRVDVTVDLFGWFLGPPAAPTEPPASNPMPRQRVLTIGDSVQAGIERNAAFDALRGARFEVRAESCRRMVRTSCDILGTGAKPTALETLRSTPRGAFDVLVMQTGYNDQLGRYEADARQILAAARAAGIRRIVWIAHAREFRTERGGRAGPQVYFEHNQVLRRIAADEVDVTLIEWNRLVRQRPAWTDPDGIHLRRPGGFALADVISRSVAHATARPCPLPEAPGAAPLAPCPDPSTRTPVAIDQLYDLSRSIVPCSIEGTRNETVCRWDHG